MRPARPVERSVAVAVGAGDVRAAAALGAMRALHRAGVPVTRLWGASSGAIFAAAMALGWDAETSVAVARRLWTADLLHDPTPRARAQLAFPRRLGFGASFGLVDDRRLREGLHRAFGSTTFEDAVVPLSLVAADVLGGEAVTLEQGPLAKALRAALALPGVFAPLPWDGALLADACLVEPLPARRALARGAGLVVALAFESPPPPHTATPVHLVLHHLSTTTRHLLRAQAEADERGSTGRILRITVPFPAGGRRFDTDLLEPAVALGEQAMEARLPALESLFMALR